MLRNRLTGERDFAVDIVGCLQMYGAHPIWHSDRHLLVTEGSFRPNRALVSWPVPDTGRLPLTRWNPG